MKDLNRRKHWETIYETKELHEVSWYQPKPEQSLELILKDKPNKDVALIDIGGGDSFLAEHLLNEGYHNISVLDISANSITRAKERMGVEAASINWIVSDIIEFEPKGQYDIWHDRAAFHFLTAPDEIEQYVALATRSLSQNGRLIIGTFSKKGPTKCSGIDIMQYSVQNLEKTFQASFELEESITVEHPTPFGSKQEFVFCVFRKK